LREEHSLRVFENRVVRRIFGPKRDEVTGEWGKLHNEELNDQADTTKLIVAFRKFAKSSKNRKTAVKAKI
jgi:hypothetical protein